MLGLDYTARIDPAALKKAGVTVVFRYVMPQTPFWTKALRNPEAAELLATGIPIVSNFESTADRMRGGAAAGHADAVNLLANWAALGAPKGLVGWFSADWDVQPGEVSAALDYLYAAAEVLGGPHYVGCYGGYRMVAAAADAGFGIWQTSAWSYGRWDPRCAARQDGGQAIVGGVEADLNTIFDLPALGAWGGPTAPSTGGTIMGTIPPSISQKWPELAGDFPANGSFTDESALIWADGGARAAALYALQARDAARTASQSVTLIQQLISYHGILVEKLNQLLDRPAATPTVDAPALAGALAPLLNAGASADNVALAVVAHLGAKLAD